MRTIRSELDRLIDWYDKYKPDAAREIPVKATEDTVKKFASVHLTPSNEKQYFYRNRKLILQGSK